MTNLTFNIGTQMRAFGLSGLAKRMSRIRSSPVRICRFGTSVLPARGSVLPVHRGGLSIPKDCSGVLPDSLSKPTNIQLVQAAIAMLGQRGNQAGGRQGTYQNSYLPIWTVAGARWSR